MKKRFIFNFLILLFLCSCGNQMFLSISDKNKGYPVNFNINIDNATQNFKTQAIDLSKLDYVTVIVDGTGSNYPKNCGNFNYTGKNLAIEVNLSNGTNLIAKISGYNNNTGKIPGADWFTVFDAPSLSDVSVNAYTTPAGKIFYHLLHDGDGTPNNAVYESYINNITLANLQTYLFGVIENNDLKNNPFDTTKISPYLVDTKGIAQFIENNGGNVPVLPMSVTSSVTGNITGLLDVDQAIITINDPASSQYGLNADNNSLFTFNKLAPSTYFDGAPLWTVSIIPFYFDQDTAGDYMHYMLSFDINKWGANYTITPSPSSSVNLDNLDVKNVDFTFAWPQHTVTEYVTDTGDGTLSTNGSIRISGTNFHWGNTTVTIDGQDATNINILNSTTLCAGIPLGIGPAGNITVSIPGLTDAVIAYPQIFPYKTEEITWIQKTSPLGQLRTSSIVNGKIYTFINSSVYEYDPSNDTWTAKANSPQNFGSTVSAVAYNNKIYVFGRSSFTGEYDPSNNTWANKAPIPQIDGSSLDGFTVGLVNTKAYLIGGYYSSRDGSNVVFEYDIENDTWVTDKAPKPSESSYHTPTSPVINNKIYVVGGWWNSHMLEVYDPANNTWETKASPPYNVIQGTATAINNKIFFTGFYNDEWSGICSNILTYDPQTDSWESKISTLPVQFSNDYISMEYLNDKIYVFGQNYSQVGTTH